ncbi:hypothetical protein ON010_g17938 [Phytophthora cinnamomi]|nr:hypothetical protein ON010_g17938 [Phytophthora cinnamomi]
MSKWRNSNGLYLRLFGLLGKGTQRSDATGLLGFLPEQYVPCALRMLAYGAWADQLDELIRIGESTVLKTMKNFCNAIMRIFGPKYLRKPTRFDLEMLLAENAARGFPGMIRSLDCMHWSWKNCPTAWAGAFKGKEKSKTVILEAVASQTLWIWHAFYGTPGSNNDLNVLERSPLLDDLVNSTAPIVHFRVNGAVYDRAYYLTDGIYPAWEIFQKSISEPNSQKDKKFKTVHEAIRKDIERAFGVLQQRFRMLAVPCKLWSVNAMGEVVMTCIILHNMIIEDEISDSTLNNNYLYEDGRVSPAPPAPSATSAQRHPPHGTCPVTNIIQELLAVEDENSHFALKNDLIEHIWLMFGDSK